MYLEENNSIENSSRVLEVSHQVFVLKVDEFKAK